CISIYIFIFLYIYISIYLYEYLYCVKIHNIYSHTYIDNYILTYITFILIHNYVDTYITFILIHTYILTFITTCTYLYESVYVVCKIITSFRKAIISAI